MSAIGYLVHPYLSTAYLAESEAHNIGFQIEFVIPDAHEIKQQIEFKVENYAHNLGFQVDQKIEDEAHNILQQVEFKIGNFQHDLGFQIDQFIENFAHNIGMEFKQGKVLHEICEDDGYLSYNYLKHPYLSNAICAHINQQVKFIIEDYEHNLGFQISQKIEDYSKNIRQQVQQKIANYSHNVGQQVLFSVAKKLNFQVTFVLYNATKLRVLMNFPSRGATTTGGGNNAWGNPKGTGENWVASSTETGDFEASNLNTDIVEQVWRSNNGDISGVTLKCDTEISQGVFLDTLGILNHNFTTSAQITLEGSTSSTFSTIGFSTDLTVIRGHENIYYIAPTLPTSGYRFWRITISDPTNTNDYLEIGSIVFGSAIIIHEENFTDTVTKTTKHFSDKIETEGYTNVSNDRALKYAINLDFKYIKYLGSNYDNFREIFETARTSLKCLWIPTPQYADRFAVFGKLAEIPVETHLDLGEQSNHVDFAVEVDESL